MAAESLILPWVQGLVGRAADTLVQMVTSMWNVDSYRLKLERQLVYVRSLLADAEEKAEAKTEAGRAVKAWMKKLKAAAYEADDVLDDFSYEALYREAQAGQPTSRKVLYFSSRDRLAFRHKASRDLKNVLDKIDELVEEMNSFGLLERVEVPQVVYQQTYSTLDKSLDVIIGRDYEREVVVTLLLDQKDQQAVQVLPIIGMGGLGKTTLVKMVFNDGKVKKHFELKMWHCVSHKFEATAIVRSIIQLATNERCDLPDNIELLQGKLKEVIGRKRFLLVLDDVWNQEQSKWEDQLKPLLCSSSGGPGSMIVVTSRSQQVAFIMGTLPPYHLTCLSEDDSWTLFSRKAFSKGVQEQPEFSTFGKQIVSNCKGLPLALKVVGGLMSSKPRVQQWEDIATSNLGEAKEEVLAILKLSYRHLSHEMKRCFAFCAVFPKDYEMEKDKLIQLWIANGFILGDGIMDLMQKGEHIFNELAWRSFLQDVNEKPFLQRDQFYYRAIGCKLHDLMHDLAKDISVECSNAVELIQKKALIEDVLHMQTSSYGLEQISGLLNGASSLRTLLITPSRHQNVKDLKLVSLRALCCDDPSVIHCQLANKAHLRYLDLSGSDIHRLPDSICMLYNLISLRLNCCKNLRYLPEGMTSLRKLRHLCLLNCDNLERMPRNLSLLHDLCILTMFVVGTEDGYGIEELRDLRQLSHKLELYKLRNVKSGSKVNLHQKQISELLLDWGHRRSDIISNDEANNEAQVLESLVPPCELEVLEVRGYHGHAISQWMRDPQMFRCLKTLTIYACEKCKDIPTVWLSPSLVYLSLSCMYNLTTLCKNIDVEAAESNYMQVFPSLRRMKLKDLPNLEMWIESSEGEPQKSVLFPQLEELEVDGCNKLSRLPEAPTLKQLSCRGCVSVGVRPMWMPLGRWPSLTRLELGLQANIAGILQEQQGESQTSLENLQCIEVTGEDAFISIFGLPKLRLGLRERLAFLEELHVMYCCNIVRWPVEELQYLHRLRSLRIWGFKKLERISSEDIISLPLLEKLDIACCDSLQEIQELPTMLEQVEISICQSLVAPPSNLGNLAKLRVLSLIDCGGIQALPDGMDGLTSLEKLQIWGCRMIEKFPPGLLQRLPHLKYLTVQDCAGLQRCCREGGEYFHLLSSIPRKFIP